MPNWVEEYIQEVGPPLEFKQFAQNATTQNIWVNGMPIGIIVYTTLGNTLSIHTMWIKPKFRNNFKRACRYLATWIKEEGFTKVELIADMRVCTLIERYLKLQPKQKIYLTDVDNILEVL
jgi:hypothetical protein|tara:strand:+ start:480 stop:839 length:360 start_codon:yes stop_codon:yes gene_type:complete